MASPSVAPNNQEKIDAAYVSTRLSTIFIGVGIVLGIWIVYFVFVLIAFVRTDPIARSSKDVALLVEIGVIALALVVISLWAAALNSERWSFGDSGNEISIESRRRSLPRFAAAVIIIMAVMIWVSGGAVNSSFSHFLGIICSLSIVLAKERRPRKVITVVSIIAYVITSIIPPGPQLLNKGWITVLHDICFPISVYLAFLAADQRKQEPAMGALPGPVTEPLVTPTSIEGEDASAT